MGTKCMMMYDADTLIHRTLLVTDSSFCIHLVVLMFVARSNMALIIKESLVVKESGYSKVICQDNFAIRPLFVCWDMLEDFPLNYWIHFYPFVLYVFG